MNTWTIRGSAGLLNGLSGFVGSSTKRQLLSLTQLLFALPRRALRPLTSWLIRTPGWTGTHSYGSVAPLVLFGHGFHGATPWLTR